MNNIQNLLGQFLGTGDQGAAAQQPAAGAPSSLADKIPGGLVGGAAAGGIVALLLGNKKARKFAGKAAGYGGAAVAGGLAYRALQNWKQAPASATAASPASVAAAPAAQPAPPPVTTPDASNATLEVKIITAMIAAAKADGHIDSAEQERIFSAMDRMNASAEIKALVFDLLRRPLSAADVCAGVEGLEHKAEVFMASCLAIDEDDPRERAYLEELSTTLQLPGELAAQIRAQAQQELQPQDAHAGTLAAPLTGTA